MILEATLTLFQSVSGALCCATLVLGQIGEMPYSQVGEGSSGKTFCYQNPPDDLQHTPRRTSHVSSHVPGEAISCPFLN